MRAEKDEGLDKPASFKDKVFASLILSGIVYIVTLSIACIIGIIYGFITNHSVFTVSRYIAELPAILMIVTFIVCIAVSVLDEIMHRNTTTTEQKPKEGEKQS